MMNKNSYLTTALLCAAAVFLNSARFDGAFHFIEYADFPICLIAWHVVFLAPGEALSACIVCGFLIDASTGQRLPTHTAAFMLYAAAGARLSGIFYSYKSIPNTIAQIALIGIFECALYALRLMAFHGAYPDYVLLMKVCSANAVVTLTASSAASTAGKKFSSYKIHAARGAVKRIR